jgi:hypothetical protein
MATIKTPYNTPNSREDLANDITNVSPMDTIFMSSVGKETATAVNHEWTIDELKAVNISNARVVGADAGAADMADLGRIGNYTQISDAVVSVSGTSRDIDTAGYADELDYQMIKKGKELKRDQESILLQNGAKVSGSNTVAAKLGGIETYISTAVNSGDLASEATGNGSDARTAGTLRDFTEVFLKDAILKSYNEGGNCDLIMVGGSNKQAASEFSGNSTLTRNVDSTSAKLSTAINVYGSDFGDMKIVANRYQNQASALIIDTNLVAVAKLRDYHEIELAKTGDADKRQLLCEYTLVVKNEKGCGAVYDLNS